MINADKYRPIELIKHKVVNDIRAFLTGGGIFLARQTPSRAAKQINKAFDKNNLEVID